MTYLCIIVYTQLEFCCFSFSVFVISNMKNGSALQAFSDLIIMSELRYRLLAVRTLLMVNILSEF